ncbi:MAG: GNAT family N-acetyltransferase [Clostridia bacterium]|nr:GNAT family N-acetyltransferase [Clostridia bacterium]
MKVIKDTRNFKNNRTATLGIFIGDKEYLSKGYGTEAIRLLLDYGFNYMNLHNIKLHVTSFKKIFQMRRFICLEKHLKRFIIFLFNQS